MNGHPRISDHSANGWLVWALALGQLIGWGTLYMSFSVVLGPMEAELGWTRTETTGAVTVGLISGGIVAFPAGYWLDRNGGRILMTLGSLLGVVMLLLWSQVHTLPLFYAIWVGIGVTMSLSLNDVPFAVITSNIRDYQRAIINLTFVSGLASIVFIPVTELLVQSFGWRQALLVLATIQVVPAMLYAYNLRHTSAGSFHNAPLAHKLNATPGPLRTALARPAFWGLLLCFSAHGFMLIGLAFHTLPLLEEGGVSRDVAISAFALIGPAQIFGRLALLLVGKNLSILNAGRLLVPLIPIAGGLLLFISSIGHFALWAHVVLFGVCNGVITIVRAVGTAQILGTSGYGEISGAMNSLLVIPRAVAPLAIAAMYNTTGGYQAAIGFLVIITTMGAIAFWLASRQGSVSEQKHND